MRETWKAKEAWRKNEEKDVKSNTEQSGGERYPVRISQKRKQISVLGEKKT